MTPETRAQNQFETALIIYNPMNRRSVDRSATAFEELQSLFPKLNIEARASGSNLRNNLAILSEQNRSRDNLIVTVGGDGLTNDVATAMIHSPTEIDSKSTLISLRSGHANDFSKSVFYKKDQDDITEIVTAGTSVDIYPLTCSVKSPDNTKYFTKIALGYISVGSSSEIANIVNEPEYRNTRNSMNRFHQRITDIRLGTDVMSKKQEYRITRPDKASILTDYYLVNCHSIAGLFHIRGNTITENNAARFEVEPGDIYFHIIKAAFGNFDRVESNFKDSFVVESAHPTFIQYDGNTQHFCSGSIIDLGISKTPIQTLTTRKQNIK